MLLNKCCTFYSSKNPENIECGFHKNMNWLFLTLIIINVS